MLHSLSLFLINWSFSKSDNFLFEQIENDLGFNNLWPSWLPIQIEQLRIAHRTSLGPLFGAFDRKKNAICLVTILFYCRNDTK